MGKLNLAKGWIAIMEIVMELVNTGNPNCKDGYIFKPEECGLSTWELEGIAQECFSRFPLPAPCRGICVDSALAEMEIYSQEKSLLLYANGDTRLLLLAINAAAMRAFHYVTIVANGEEILVYSPLMAIDLNRLIK